jgi:hypothetical protein
MVIEERAMYKYDIRDVDTARSVFLAKDCVVLIVVSGRALLQSAIMDGIQSDRLPQTRRMFAGFTRYCNSLPLDI